MRLIILTTSIFLLTIGSLTAQTSVSGNITSNTTWTVANSPYIATAHVIVNPGVVLTIQPGVTIKFDAGVHLEVQQGKLVALGDSVNHITWMSNLPSPSQSSWGGIHLNNAVSARVRYCDFSFSGTAMTGDADTIVVRNSSFTRCANGFEAQADLAIQFMQNSFYRCLNAMEWSGQADIRILQCSFVRNNIAFDSQTQSSLFNCVIDSNTNIGIRKKSGCQDTVAFNTITNNGTGYTNVGSGCGGLVFIHKNQIYNNNIGVDLVYGGGMQYLFRNNCICNNTVWDFRTMDWNDVDLTYNSWCKSDSVSVSMKIYDAYDQVQCGFVDFMPMDTAFCYNPLGVNEAPAAAAFDMYPNPASSTLWITPEETAPATIRIINLLGEVQLSFTAQGTSEIDIAALPAGIYFVEVRQQNKVGVRKFIKE